MFDGVISDTTIITKTLKQFSIEFMELAIKITDNEWQINSPNLSNTVLLNWTLSDSNFSQYNNEKENTVVVNLKRFVSILERFKTARIVINDTNIIISDESNTFIIPQVEITEELSQMNPDITFDSSFMMSMDELKEAIKNAEMVSELIKIEIKDGEVSIDTKSETYGSFQKNITAEDIKTSGFSASSFSTDFMKLAISNVFETAKVEMIKEGPIRISNEIEGLKQSIIIAPRLLED